MTQSGITYDDITFLDFSELGANLSGEHITAATLNLFDIWATQCTTTEEVYAYQVTGSWSINSSLTYPGPAYGTKDAQWTGVAPADACSNTSGLLGKGGWLGLALNSSGLALLNDWTDGSGVANEGFAVAPSMTDAEMFKQFDSYADSNVATSQGGDCDGDCRPYLSVTYTADVPPQVNSQFPPDNYNSPTLTPELIASAVDPDSWPDASPRYLFTVFNSAGTQIASSGPTPVSSADWPVPAGVLSWGQTYYWTVQAYDGVDYSAKPEASYFTTAVPQPLVTSQLSQNTSGPGFDPETGNWTTSATDADVASVGPALDITRDYNRQSSGHTFWPGRLDGSAPGIRWIVIREGSPEECLKVSLDYGVEAVAGRLYVIGGNLSSFVVSARPQWHEDQGGSNDPSWFGHMVGTP